MTDKPATKPNLCLCGCGAETKSRFRPGHDAKLKSRLINTALDESAPKRDRTKAEAQLATLGWSHLLETSRVSRAAKAARAAAQAEPEEDEPEGES